LDEAIDEWNEMHGDSCTSVASWVSGMDHAKMALSPTTEKPW
jgi:hypothetical protein